MIYNTCRKSAAIFVALSVLAALVSVWPVQAEAYRVYMPAINNDNGAPSAPSLTPTFTPISTSTPTPSPTIFATPTRDPELCDPAYPTVCIPPPPPDLDCGDIPYRRFTVLPPDPHGFDRDDDGIGCET